MKNLTYFPFERNRYFYGKLLAVDDFETEQKYFNDKRRVLNRYGLGTGVVLGLDTVQVDEKTISVERGIALDFAGREIVVDTPVISQLSALNGFADHYSNDRGYYYLCLEYDEKEKQVTHNVALDEKEGLESNKYEETYQLFLTTQEPQKTILTADFAREDSKQIYSGNGLRITQVVPRFIESDETFLIKVFVENVGVLQPYSFEYQLEGICVAGEENEPIQIRFDSCQMEDAERFVVSIPLKAMDVSEVTGKVMLLEDSFRLEIGQEQVQVSGLDVTQNIHIVQNGILDRIAGEYHKNAMEAISQNSYQQSIYLAKLWVIHAGASYIIDKIEKMPYSQYVMNQELSYSLICELDKKIEKIQRNKQGDSRRKQDSQAELPLSPKQMKLESGSYVFDLGIGGKAGQVFLSPELEHHLGIGPAAVTVGVTDSEKEDIIYYGETGVFEACKGVPDVELGVQLDAKKGTFVIGMKLRATTTMHFVTVHWSAYKKEETISEMYEGKAITIKPDMPSIEVGENIYFEAVCGGFKDERLVWSVKGENDGMVSQQGVYHAPNITGVYEVHVASSKYPEVKASTFIVVSDTKEK